MLYRIRHCVRREYRETQPFHHCHHQTGSFLFSLSLLLSSIYTVSYIYVERFVSSSSSFWGMKWHFFMSARLMRNNGEESFKFPTFFSLILIQEFHSFVFLYFFNSEFIYFFLNITIFRILVTLLVIALYRVMGSRKGACSK